MLIKMTMPFVYNWTGVSNKSNNGGKMKKINLIILMTCLIINLFAYSLLEYEAGNYVQTVSARSSAMGTSGVAIGYSLFDSSLNPANITLLNNKLNADLALTFTKNEEDRSLPMFNFFDSYIDNSTYSNNNNIFTNVSAGASYSHQMDSMTLSAGLMSRPLVDFSAKYEEQVRNDNSSDDDTYPPILAKNFKEGEGAINAYSAILGASYSFSDVNKLTLGLEIAMLNGSQNQESRIVWTEIAYTETEEALSDSLFKSARDYDGMMFRLGATYDLNDRVRLGFAFQPKTECDMTAKNTIKFENIDTVTEMDADYIIPSSMRWGITYLPRNPYKTTFQMDMELNNYSEVSKFYDDVYSIYIGMEHYVGRAIPLRMGFKHEQSFGDAEIGAVSMPTVSAGTAFPIAKNLVFNISGEFSTRTYETLDLFRDGFYKKNGLWTSINPTDRGWENPDKVEEQFFKVQTNISFTW